MKEEFKNEIDNLIDKYHLSFEALADIFKYYADRFAKYKEMLDYLEEYTE